MSASLHQFCRTAGFVRADVYPDPPVVHGIPSSVRRILWSVRVLPVCMMFAAETERLDPVLTRNLTAVVSP